MSIRILQLLTAILVSTLFLGACGDGSSSDSDDPIPPAVPLLSSPNIVVILADDLGYGSLNSYGAYTELVRTPQIDRLAEEGVRFTNAYASSSVCSPTRYGLLMGRYPWRTEKKASVVNFPDPLWPSTERMNLPKWLKSRGYTTATIGKWHLGYGAERPTGDIEELVSNTMPGPEALGFDYSFSVPHNHGDRYGVYFEDGKVVGYDDQGQLVGLRSMEKKDYGDTVYGLPFVGFDVPQRIDERVTQQITARAIAWMEMQVEEDNGPFFLYLTPVAVHNPITPSVETSGTSAAGPYGDFIHDLDGSVGQVLASLDEMGIADDTLVIFASDNGGATPGRQDTPQRLAINNGFAINGSLRGGKASIWEGGTRVPLIVRMPGYSLAGGGRQSSALANLTDIFATVVDLIGDGAELPDDVAPDSVSFLAAIQSRGSQDRALRTSTITTSFHGIAAIRSGEWKWIEGVIPVGYRDDAPADQIKPQLYNLRDTPGETEDVSSHYPDIVERLREELKIIRESE